MVLQQWRKVVHTRPHACVTSQCLFHTAGRGALQADHHQSWMKKLSFSPPLFLPGSWPFTDFFSRIPSYCDTLIKDKAIFLVPRKKYPPEGPRIIFIYIPTLQFQGRDGTLRDVYMSLPGGSDGSSQQHHHVFSPHTDTNMHQEIHLIPTEELYDTDQHHCGNSAVWNTCCLRQNMCRY